MLAPDVFVIIPQKSYKVSQIFWLSREEMSYSKAEEVALRKMKQLRKESSSQIVIGPELQAKSPGQFIM